MRNASTNAGHRPQGDGAVPQPAYRPSIAMCRADAVGDGVYALTSSWQGNVNGKLVIVHVGALRGDARRGAIIVTEMPADLDRRCGRHFEGPAGCGSLRIIDSSEDRLLISCANGKTYWFAIPTPDSPDRPPRKHKLRA